MLSSVMEDPKPYVLMFQDDFERIRDWVLQYPDRETGGQFFGLWTHNKNPYINIVIGPGQGCRHETHSFHQDIPYFEDVGTFLNGEFMMCHIGEWHSHHRLRLRQPSSGDLNSIWKHFPSGVERFLLVIATIESNDVKLWPWLFTASNHEHNLIELKIIKKDNVFMIDEVITNRIAKGAEKRKVESKHSSGTHHSLWFHSSLGASFVQHLHSELNTFVKAGDEIKKTLDAKGLEFSFPHHNFHWVLLFPPSFPRCGVSIKRQSKKYPASVTMVNHANDNPYDGLVNQLVKYIREHCDYCQNGKKAPTVFYVYSTV